MNSRSSKLKFKDVQKHLAGVGISLRHDDGEYRVSFSLAPGRWPGLTKKRAEDTAYYTNDLHDAQATGFSMAKTGFIR